MKTFRGKLLGALALMCAVIAVGGAPPAPADYFSASTQHADLTGQQQAEATNRLEIAESGAAVECTTGSYAGALELPPASEVALHPSFSGCYSPGLAPNHGEVQIGAEGCDLLLTGVTDESEQAAADLRCEEGQEVRATLPGCTVAIPEQELLGGGVHYANPEASPEEVLVEAALSGVEYATEGALCFLVEGSGEDLGLTSTIALRGYEEGEEHTAEHQVGVTADGS